LATDTKGNKTLNSPMLNRIHKKLASLAAVYTLLLGQLAAQPLSFERSFSLSSSDDFVEAIETPDDGFLVLFKSRLIKLDRKGRTEWSHSTSKVPNPDPKSGHHHPIFNNILMDSSHIFLQGGAFNSPFYWLLNHNGEKLFDTLYLVSWRFPEMPFAGLGYTDLVGEEIVSITHVYTNLKYDSTTHEQTFDNLCVLFQKINKQTGHRTYYKQICLSDSNENIGHALKLNTTDQGYLVRVFYTMTNVDTDIHHNVLLRLDSLGNIVELNDLFPRDIFPNQQEQGVNLFKPIYDPDMFSGKYLPLQYTFDSAAQGLWVRGRVGKTSFTQDVIAFYDSNGKMVYWREDRNWDYKVKSNIQNISIDTVAMFDSLGVLLWKNYFNRKTGILDLQKILYTYKNGIVRILKSYNEPYTYTVQHIGPQGYDFGYDPAPAWHEEDSLAIWFNAMHGLTVHPQMLDWEIKIFNTLGQELRDALAYDPKNVPLGFPLPQGVYIVQMRNPQSGRIQYRKLWKN
jgi:hypothetical protein